jgi:tetratricopeptide (TPR) repeat protein
MLVVGARYRLPLALPLALFGGIAIAYAWELRDRRRLAAMAVIAIVAGASTRAWPHPPSHDLAEEWALTSQALTNEEKPVEAESAARQAIESDAKNALAWDALGLALDQANRKSEARDALLHATALNPQFESAHLHLGNVLAAMGDGGAAREYAAAIDLSPHDPRPVAHLAPLLAQRGDLAGAQRLYARLVELSPGDADAMLTLARIDGALGKPAEGLAVAQRAATIRDVDPQDWIVIALLAAQSGKNDVATTALQRAGSAADSPQGMFIAALIAHGAHRDDDALRTLDALLARVPDFAEARRLREAIKK